MYHHGMSTASQAFICFLPPGERRASPWPRSRWMTQGPIKHNPLPIPDIHHGQHHTQRQRSQRHRDGHRHLHLRCRLCPFAREDHRHWRHAVHPRRLPRRTVPRLASHIHTRHSGHRALPSPLTTCGPTSSISRCPPSSRAVEPKQPSRSPTASLSPPPASPSLPPPKVAIAEVPPPTVVANGPTNTGPRLPMALIT